MCTNILVPAIYTTQGGILRQSYYMNNIFENFLTDFFGQILKGYFFLISLPCQNRVFPPLRTNNRESSWEAFTIVSHLSFLIWKKIVVRIGYRFRYFIDKLHSEVWSDSKLFVNISLQLFVISVLVKFWEYCYKKFTYQTQRLGSILFRNKICSSQRVFKLLIALSSSDFLFDIEGLLMGIVKIKFFK